MTKELKALPENIKYLLDIDMMNWDFDQMNEFSNWQAETNTYPGPMQENTGPQPLPCFWERRGINVHNCH